MPEVTIIAAFIAGLVMFFNPCVLPLLPAYLGYLAGTSLAEKKTAKNNIQLKIFINACLFVLGFIAVFAILGLLLTTVLKHASETILTWLSRIGGIIIIAFGLYLLGLFKIPALQREKSLQFNLKPSYIASFIFGATFAVGWTPCIGPVLGAIFGLAAAHPASAFALLITFALGFSIPFLLVGAFTAHASKWIKQAAPWFRYFEIVVGILLIILGILVFFNMLTAFGHVTSFGLV